MNGVSLAPGLYTITNIYFKTVIDLGGNNKISCWGPTGALNQKWIVRESGSFRKIFNAQATNIGLGVDPNHTAIVATSESEHIQSWATDFDSTDLKHPNHIRFFLGERYATGSPSGGEITLSFASSPSFSDAQKWIFVKVG